MGRPANIDWLNDSTATALNCYCCCSCCLATSPSIMWMNLISKNMINSCAQHTYTTPCGLYLSKRDTTNDDAIWWCRRLLLHFVCAVHIGAAYGYSLHLIHSHGMIMCKIATEFVTLEKVLSFRGLCIPDSHPHFCPQASPEMTPLMMMMAKVWLFCI